jgi:hypothetical protein
VKQPGNKSTASSILRIQTSFGARIHKWVAISLATSLLISCNSSYTNSSDASSNESDDQSCQRKPTASLKMVDGITTETIDFKSTSLAIGNAMVGELNANLIADGMTDFQAAAIANGAELEMQMAVGSFTVDTTGQSTTNPIAVVAAPIVRGAITAMNDPCAGMMGLSSARAATARSIMASTVSSLGGRTEELGTTATLALIGEMVGGAVEKMSSAGLGGDAAPSALASITSGAVGALSKAQIPQELIGQGAQSVASGAVTALSSIGANQSEIGNLAGAVAASAIQSLSSAGLSADEIIQSGAISAIVSGAASALSSAGVSGDSSATAIGAIAGAAVGAFAKAGIDSPSLRQSALADVVGGSMEGAKSISPNSGSDIAAAMSSVASQAVSAMLDGGFKAEDMASATSTIVETGIAKIVTLGVGNAADAIAISSKIMEGAMAGAAGLASSGQISTERVSSLATAATSSAVSGLVVLQNAGVVKDATQAASFNSSISSSTSTGLANGGVSSEVVESIQSTVAASVQIQSSPKAPTISSIANQTINEDSGSGLISFDIADQDSTLTCANSLSFISGDAALVPGGAAVFGGSAPNCTVQFNPASNINGSTTLTIKVSDGSLNSSASFTLTVSPVNDAPTISTIANQTIEQDASTPSISVTVGDIDSSLASLVVQGSSSNTTLVPNANIVISGSGSARTIVITPATGLHGSAAITISVSDGALESTRSFTLTVNPPALSCPANYVLVPGNSSLGTSDFCVMKYEAKNSSSVATSQSSGTPWVGVLRGVNSTIANSAWNACKSIGPNYDLITNAQWQTIARNIEGVSSNWSNGSSSGDNFINRGTGATATAASTDQDPCPGSSATDCTNGAHADFDKKRTHSLSNGAIIWDIAGNVWEWVQDDLSSNQGASANVSELTHPTYDLLKWGPSGDHSSKTSASFYGGLGSASLSNPEGGVLRGGDSGDSRGIFATYLNISLSFAAANTGFRCVMNATSPFASAPSGLPTPDLVLDANSIAGADGTAVNQWLDISGKAASTYNQSPTLVVNAINGRKAVAFNGSNQALEVSAQNSPISGANAFTIAVVFQPAAAGTGGSSAWYQNSGIVDGEQPGGTHDWGMSWSSESKVAAGVGSSDTTVYSSALATTSTHIAIYRWDGSTGSITLNVDGTTSSESPNQTTARNSYALKLGSINGENGKYFNGKIAYVRIDRTALPDSQVSQLGDWLVGLYGVTGVDF